VSSGNLATSRVVTAPVETPISTGVFVWCWGVTSNTYYCINESILGKWQNGYCNELFRLYNSDMARKPKMGRPTLDPAGATSQLHAIRLTADEKHDYELAAGRAGMTASAWMRDRLNKAAAREAKRPATRKKARGEG
jgi:hypothetical protein